MVLNIETSFNKVSNKYFVKPIGEVDIHTFKGLEEIMVNALKEKQVELVIDGENLEYIDSTGLGALMNALKKSKEIGKEIEIINLKPSIKKLFFLTSLDKLFKMEEK